MSYVVDGSLFPVIQLPDDQTGALFGPDITRIYVGTEAGLIAKRDELQLDRRGVAYDLARQGETPVWNLILRMTYAQAVEDPSDPEYEENFELPVNIIWRLTNELSETDYRKVGRYEEALNGLASVRRREFQALLEDLLAGEIPPEDPSWIGLEPAGVQALLNELIVRFERGKNTTYLNTPVLARDASFRKEANYRASIIEANALYTSAALIAVYPEIPGQFQDAMPTNGSWKCTRNDWEVETSGQGRESIMFTWSEWHDPIDYVVFVI